MSRTLNQLIESAVLGGEEAEEVAPPRVETVHEAPAHSEVYADLADAEKVAGALEFLGRRGIANLLGGHEKLAMCAKCGKSHKGGKKCPYCGGMKKKAAEHGLGNVGTNAGQMHREHVQRQVPHNRYSSPMSQPGHGAGITNAGQKPGGGAGSVDTSGTGHGTHHSALSSNESAINYDKREKAKKVSPALSRVLKASAFSDPKLKENLSNASGKGDKNIHTKKASENDLGAIRAELARRAQGRN